MPASEPLIETDPTPDQVQYLEDRLSEFNSIVTGIKDGEGLAILVRDAGGRIVAGICGHTWAGYCEIRQFCVIDDYPRGHQNLLLRKRLGEAAECRGPESNY